MSFDLTDVRVLDFVPLTRRECDRGRPVVFERESRTGNWFKVGDSGRGMPSDWLLMLIEKSGPLADPRILARWGERQNLPKLPKVTP